MTTVADAELKIANSVVATLVDVLRRLDPAFCEAHDVEQVTDDEIDEAIEEAEDWLEEQA